MNKIFSRTLDRLLDGEHLAEAEAFDLMNALGEGTLEPALAGALLAGLRAKGETADEIRGFGSMVTFTIRGGLESIEKFIQQTRHLPFFPSLGDVSTSMSHPVSTSHRGLSDEELEKLGFSASTIRLSVGCELADSVWNALDDGLQGCSRCRSASRFD